MTEQKLTARMKNLICAGAVLLGLALIVGATSNLPASAQGLVTGQNDILVDQLVDRVGAQALTEAVLNSEIADIERPEAERSERVRPETEQRRNRDNRRRGEARENSSERARRGARQNNNQLDGGLDDQLERLGPETVYQIAVEAALITQAEANAMLEQ